MINTTKRIVSFDPSLRHWGYAEAIWSDDVFEITNTGTIHTQPSRSSKHPKGYYDVQSAFILYNQLIDLVSDKDIVTIELPVGSQSSRAATAMGICFGLIGALKHANPNIVFVTPMDVKKVVRTDSQHKPSKLDVIEWVLRYHPDLDIPLKDSSQHMCDAIAAIYAATHKPEFKALLL